MNKILHALSDLKLKESEFDAISFFKKPTGEYVFFIMKSSNPIDDYVIDEDLGYMYYMLYLESDGTCSVQEAILGDSVHILKNQIRGNAQGIFVKKCALGKKILEKLVFGPDSAKRFEDYRALIASEAVEV